MEVNVSDSSYGDEFKVVWFTCKICGMTDKTVELIDGNTLHRDATICMNKALGAPLSVVAGDRYQGREPPDFSLDASEEEAIRVAVQRWIENNQPEEEDDPKSGESKGGL